MRRLARMRRLWAASILPIVAPLIFAVASMADIGYLGWRCLESPQREGFGSEVYGIGTRTQAALQYRLFVNRFSAECRPDVQGLVSFRGESEDVVVGSMIQRERDPLGRPYTFYALDRPLTTAEKERIETDADGRLLRISPVLQIPLWIEGIALAYNPPCPVTGLKLSSAALTAVFSGVAERWNDPLLVTDNPQLALCTSAIRVAVRSDDSAQTTVFKDYLSKRSASWKAYMTPDRNRDWPATLLDPCRGRGDQGMVGCIAGLPGSIGYVGFAEAFRNGLPVAAVENRAGFVGPSLDECTRAAESPTGGYPARADLDWSATSLTDPPSGYPICNLVFALAFEKMSPAYGGSITVAEVRTVRDFVWTAVRADTQRRLTRYGVAPLPEFVRSLIAEPGAESIGYFE
ncbi:MAG TPA: substrate-binding domain-containing protein [Actinomycetota bacterium]|nr:substrate-binding domain-containing protein [Actinomycetota bacterium]